MIAPVDTYEQADGYLTHARCFAIEGGELCWLNSPRSCCARTLAATNPESIRLTSHESDHARSCDRCEQQSDLEHSHAAWLELEAGPLVHLCPACLRLPTTMSITPFTGLLEQQPTHCAVSMCALGKIGNQRVRAIEFDAARLLDGDARLGCASDNVHAFIRWAKLGSRSSRALACDRDCANVCCSFA